MDPSKPHINPSERVHASTTLRDSPKEAGDSPSGIGSLDPVVTPLNRDTVCYAGILAKIAVADCIHALNQPSTAILNYGRTLRRGLNQGIHPADSVELLDRLLEQASKGVERIQAKGAYGSLEPRPRVIPCGRLCSRPSSA